MAIENINQPEKGEDRAGVVILVLIVVLAAIASWYRHHDLVSRDALSVWLAAQAWAVGAFDQIYAPVKDVFLMRPPVTWFEGRWAMDDFGEVFPYLYPPIWAALLSQATTIWTFEQFASLLAILNPLLFGGAICLAARTCVPAEARPTFVVTGVLFLACTAVGIVALEQNQPQIIVSALTVLAAFLLFMHQPVASGSVLAVAAAMKLSPALFVIIFIARGERRALGGFLLTGSALGFASLYLAGWPLHAHMLETLSSISRSVLNTFFTFSLDPVIAERFFFSEFRMVPSDPTNPQNGGWAVMAKPYWWQIMDGILILAALAGVYLAARQFDDILMWPFAVVVLSLVAPLSWGYHYLAAFAFVPALIWRLPGRAGLIGLIAVFAPLSVPLYRFAFQTPIMSFWMATIGTSTMILYAALLFWAMKIAERS